MRPWAKEQVNLAIEPGPICPLALLVVVVLIRGEKVGTPVPSIVNVRAVTIDRRTEDGVDEWRTLAAVGHRTEAGIAVRVLTSGVIAPGEQTDALAEGRPERVDRRFVVGGVGVGWSQRHGDGG